MMTTNESKTLAKIKAMPHVRDAYRDSDGYWILYQAGYISPHTDCALDREDTAAEALKAARDAASLWFDQKRTKGGK